MCNAVHSIKGITVRGISLFCNGFKAGLSSYNIERDLSYVVLGLISACKLFHPQILTTSSTSVRSKASEVSHSKGSFYQVWLPKCLT